jgi:membrane associated rhomboid family serine protease
VSSPDPRQPSREQLAEVARYPLRTQAQERSLVILALGLGCWIFQEKDAHILCVQPGDAAVARSELDKFERETTLHAPRDAARTGKIPVAQLVLFAWFFTALFMFQNLLPENLADRGIASSERIVSHGEWWRAVTALTLHADLAHFVGNLATGLLYAAFLLPLVGGGVTWSGMLFAGTLGNLVNAWAYRGAHHQSLGASTAVFGTLGMLVAFQCSQMLLHENRPRLWQIILPVGAGVALLAYLGTGDYEHPDRNTTDYMAHLWGFCAGIALGAGAAFAHTGTRLPANAQRFLAAIPPIAIMAAWMAAMSR